MRFNPHLSLTMVGDEPILFVAADGTVNMNRVVALNKSSLVLYNTLKDCDFYLDDAVAVLLRHFEVDELTARRDVQDWIDTLQRNGLLL